MNEHITKNLENYLSIKNPQYAILLSGKWGCGKTFFIDAFLENYKDKDKDKKFIKVSLFGLKNISEVNNKIILQLLNVEGSRLGQIAKIAQSYTKKLNIPVQDLPIDKFFKMLKIELIFIFDDLERVNTSYSEILGYINYLVEQSNFKVIILANDTEITDNKFTKFKEKVIGKTFEIQQNFDEVLTVFLDLASDSKGVLTANKRNIKNIYAMAGYKNLRHTRQTVLDFKYFYGYIDDKFKNHNVFLRDIICLFFMLSIEVKKGELESSDKVNFDKILGKENWKNILFKGNIIKNDINKAIANTSYFAKGRRESWVRLRYFHNLEDKEFKKILADVSEKFNRNKYLDREKLLQVVAALLYLSKEGLYTTPQKDIVKRAKDNINANAKTKPWQQNKYIHDGFFGNCIRYSFICHESSEFKETVKYLEQKSQEAFNVGLKAKGDELLQNFKNNDIEALNEKLDKLSNVAIFSLINVDVFIDILLKIKHANLLKIITTLKGRFNNQAELKQDLKFWQDVDDNLLNEISKDQHPIKYFYMDMLKIHIKKMIDASKSKE